MQSNPPYGLLFIADTVYLDAIKLIGFLSKKTSMILDLLNTDNGN